MRDYTELNKMVESGKVKAVKELVTAAINDGCSPKEILEEGLLPGMNAIGEKFKNNEVYVPEVLIAARAMNAGAYAVALAEPVTGLLSPALAEEFSAPYVKQIVDAVQDENFLVLYHNCGNGTIPMIDSILSCGAAICHFGNAIDMEKMLDCVPEDVVVMGNIDPAGEFSEGTPESITKAATAT